MIDNAVSALSAAAIAADAASLNLAVSAREILTARTSENLAAYNAAISEVRAACHSAIVPWFDDAVTKAEAVANEAVAAVTAASHAAAALAAATREIAVLADFVGKQTR